jgi:hypothetical protein
MTEKIISRLLKLENLEIQRGIERRVFWRDVWSSL